MSAQGKRIFLRIFLVLLSSTQVLFAQLRTYTIEDGLPNRTIFRTLEDHEGFLWVGTFNGLARFDGNEFVTLENVGEDSASLQNPHITALAETPDGQLCIGTLEGWAILSRERDQLTYPVPTDHPSAQHYIASIAAFDEDHIAFASRSDVHILTKGGQLKTVALSNKPDGMMGIKLERIDENRVLVMYLKDESTGKNFITIDRSGNVTQDVQVNSTYFDGLLGPDHQVYLVGINSEEDGNNKIRLESYTLNGELTNQWQMDPPFPVNEKGDHLNLSFALGYLWINQNNTPITRFDPTSGQFSLSIGEEIARTKSPLTNNFYNATGDSHDNLWLASNAGLLGLSLKESRFQALRPPQLPESEIYSTRALYRWDDEHLFISELGNSFLMNMETQQFTPFDPKKPDGSPAHIRCILPHESGRLLIGTEWSSLFWLNRGSSQLERAVPKSKALKSVLDMAPDKDGRIWAVGIQSLFWFDFEEGVIHEIPDLPYSEIQTIYGIQYDRERHVLWMVCDAGLLRYDIEGGEHTIFDLKFPDRPLAIARSMCILQKENTLWIGTWESGLVQFEIEQEKITHYTSQNGLCHNLIYSILEDDSGRLWLGTAKGLSVFDPLSEEFENYFEKDGIAHNEFNTGSVYRADNGTLYMGGVDGLTVFNPDEVLAENRRTHLRLTRITHHDGKRKRVIEAGLTIGELEKLTIYPEDRYFTVHFTPADMLSTTKSFEYRLEGLEDDWNFLDEQQEIRFAGLPPGSFVLRIREAGHSNDTQNILSLPIEVLKPWYQQWWAVTLFVVSILAMLFAFFFLRLKQLNAANQLKLEQLKVEKKEEVDQLKSDFFANISHEFRTPLTLILGPIEKGLASENKSTGEKSLRMMRRNSYRLLSLINQLLDLSKLDSGKVKFQPIVKDLNAHLRLLCSNFESLAVTRNIDLKLTTDANNLLVYYDVDQMEKIINNLLSNALKFSTAGGWVKIECAKLGNHAVQISVSNTGQDIPAHVLPNLFKRFYQQEKDMGQGTGIGLALTKELVELHKGTIAASSDAGITTFTVELPLNIARERIDEFSEDPETEAFESVAIPAEIRFETEPSEELDEQESQDSSVPLVLVVDDNADLRDFLTEILQSDYQVVKASNGREGWEKARERIPDLVVSDLMMPEMDGNELCDKLKTDELTSHIPVILLTAKATQESKLEGLKKGADDYLMKPFNGAELLIRAKNLIQLRRLLQEKYSGRKLAKMGKQPVLDLEDKFLQKVIGLIDLHLSEEDFTANIFYEELFLSPRQIQRKLKALTGQTPTNFIRQYRLQKAYEMIQRKEGTISEIAVAVGIPNLTYFGRSFKREFGISPSEL